MDIVARRGARRTRELLAFNQNSPDGRPLLAHLDDMFLETIRETHFDMQRSGELPPSGIAKKITRGSHTTSERIEIYTVFEFEFYEGKIDCYLLNGSYCLSSGDFIGSQSLRRISIGDDYPGPVWTLVERAVDARKNYFCAMLYAMKYSDRLQEALKGPIPKYPVDGV